MTNRDEARHKQQCKELDSLRREIRSLRHSITFMFLLVAVSAAAAGFSVGKYCG